MNDDWPFEDPENTAVFTTRQVLEGAPIVRVSHDEDDGAWQFHTEAPPRETDARLIALSEAVELDPSLLELAGLPVGWVATRAAPGAPWMWHPTRTETDSHD